jgi:cell division transport system permease protein
MNSSRLFDNVKRNIRRTPYQALAACMVMFLTFLVLTIFSLLAIGSQQILKYYESKPQAIAFFKDNTSAQDISAIQAALNQTGKVSNIKFISKDEALQIYRERNKNNPQLLELVTANILPPSLEVSTTGPEDLAPIVEILKKEPVIEEVVYPEDVVKTIAQATTLIRYVGIGVVTFLLVFSILAILMIIGFKIRVQRHEIETMKLLGASDWFIRSPYILEGAFYGLFGAFFSWLTSYLLLWYLTPFLQSSLGLELKLLPVSVVLMLEILAVTSLVSILVGTIGSYGALRRYLKL